MVKQGSPMAQRSPRSPRSDTASILTSTSRARPFTHTPEFAKAVDDLHLIDRSREGLFDSWIGNNDGQALGG